MLDGYKSGVITEGGRLQDALRRILGLKASLGLHVRQELVPPRLRRSR